MLGKEKAVRDFRSPYSSSSFAADRLAGPDVFRARGRLGTYAYERPSRGLESVPIPDRSLGNGKCP